MIVTHNITIDCKNPNTQTPRLDMVQGDTGTRTVAVSLTADGEPFELPDDVKVMVRYRKADGTGGVYDTMPNGDRACSVRYSTVTVQLAPQVLTCPGMVCVSLALTNGSQLLGIFHFTVRVQADPSAGLAESENYFSYETLSQVNAGLIRLDAAFLSLNARMAELTSDLIQLEPYFANSEEECTDTDKLYVLPDGYIYAHIPTHLEGELINYLPSAVDANGQPYNGGQGWKANTKLDISGAEAAAEGTEVTGYIPMKRGDVLRFENMSISGWFMNNTQRIAFYDSQKALITAVYTHEVPLLESQSGYVYVNEEGFWACFDTYNAAALDDTKDWTDLAYFRISADTIQETSAIYINERRETVSTVYNLVNTGHAFVPADYEDRILLLEETADDHTEVLQQVEKRLDAMETNLDSVVLPDYWREHCRDKVEAIQSALETAGRSKSAFFWYTDAHWADSARMSPRLLKFLYNNTAINKTNFGGDIGGAGTANSMDSLRQWRQAVRDIPNHHSVAGDGDRATAGLASDKQRYSFLMAAEETPNIVRGGDFTYYIDDPNEKTRYLYLDTGMCTTANAAGEAAAFAFAVEALSTTPDGWHIVPISHIWFQHKSVSQPTSGSVPKYCLLLLKLFDGYNARKSGSYSILGTAVPYDFTNAGGRVEFCVGGHTHVDHQRSSTDGIPVILTETDSLDVRSGLDAVVGTADEASISAIIADYDSGKISVIRIGRGEDFEIML